MKEELLKKMSLEQFSLTDDEVKWLLENVGNPDPTIRDELVFEMLAISVEEGFLTEKQYRYLKDETISENLMFYHIDETLPATLTRSFAVLLNSCLIGADGNNESPYYHVLEDKERNYFFQAAETYLYKEKDTTSYSTEYGWVHAFGHFGDYLLQVVFHDLYDMNQFKKVLDSIYFVFKNLDHSFEFGEERRLAYPIVEGLIQNVIPQQMLAKWISETDFPVEENQDYCRIAAFENFLAYIYFKMLDEMELEEPLKKAMLNYLKKYTVF